ncbi:hypothetical protein [Costertonia aggregata]|uniref:Uncharacterized protein n=1 Tax=Costertonia aggregata TaxID=343403 RepID=A0A7H9APN6_9FLAO|nr:hypothetical protein [Costertonia aggregata]QLG45390.1 hypothetical protein HYG79_08530 [Costertonia aggregata]
MTTIPLEVGNLDGLIYFFAVIMFGPALLFAIIGLLIRKKNPKAAKVFYILAGVYLLVSLGVCGGLMSGY